MVKRPNACHDNEPFKQPKNSLHRKVSMDALDDVDRMDGYQSDSNCSGSSPSIQTSGTGLRHVSLSTSGQSRCILKHIVPGSSIHTLFAVEVFAGSAKLSAALKDIALRVFPIDHGHNQHRPRHKIFKLDLSNLEHQHILMDLLSTPGLVFC